MTDYEKAEFWAAMGRLYDDCQALKEATSKLADTARAHQYIAEAHEKRLDHMDVVQQWLAEKERAREKRAE